MYCTESYFEPISMTINYLMPYPYIYTAKQPKQYLYINFTQFIQNITFLI